MIKKVNGCTLVIDIIEYHSEDPLDYEVKTYLSDEYDIDIFLHPNENSHVFVGHTEEGIYFEILENGTMNFSGKTYEKEDYRFFFTPPDIDFKMMEDAPDDRMSHDEILRELGI